MAVLGRTTIPNADIGRVSQQGQKGCLAGASPAVIIRFGNNLPARGFPRIRSLSRKVFRRACPNPRAPRDSGAMVAHRLPKPRVAGSSPVYRSHLEGVFIGVIIKLKVSVTPLTRDGVVGECRGRVT